MALSALLNNLIEADLERSNIATYQKFGKDVRKYKLRKKIMFLLTFIHLVDC